MEHNQSFFKCHPPFTCTSLSLRRIWAIVLASHMGQIWALLASQMLNVCALLQVSVGLVDQLLHKGGGRGSVTAKFSTCILALS